MQSRIAKIFPRQLYLSGGIHEAYASWLAEVNAPVVYLNNILRDCRSPTEAIAIYRIINDHEWSHIISKESGFAFTLCYLNMMGISDVLRNRQDCIDKVKMKDEAANILFRASRPILEALYVYLREEPPPPEQAESILETSQDANMEKTRLSRLERTDGCTKRTLESFAEVMRKVLETLLKDNKTKKVYEQLKRLRELSQSNGFPEAVASLALDIPVQLSAIELIEGNTVPPFLVPFERFKILIEHLEQLDKKKPLSEWSFIKRFTKAEKEFSTNFKLYARASYELTSHLASLTNLLTVEHDWNKLSLKERDILTKIFYEPRFILGPAKGRRGFIDLMKNRSISRDFCQIVSSVMKYYRYIVSLTGLYSSSIYLSFVKNDDPTHLILLRNPAAPDNVASVWMKNFILTLAKEVVVNRSSLNSILKVHVLDPRARYLKQYLRKPFFEAVDLEAFVKFSLKASPKCFESSFYKRISE